MNKRTKRILKLLFGIPLLLICAAIAFLLYETQDQINATPSNIEEKLARYCNPKKMAGFAVSVFSADVVIYSNGFGFADVENQVPYTKNTQQYIASVSKIAIGIALLKGEELGLLKIEDPINKHLPFKISNPNFPEKEITIMQLANHTSSLDYNEKVVESLYIEDSSKQKSLELFMVDYFQNGKMGEVKFTADLPGTNWNYSNIGSGLAAYIIEFKSGMSFADFTQKYIFSPLEMTNTSWFESEGDSLFRTSYFEPKEDSISMVKNKGVKLYPCRDMITDIEDLTKYCQSIISKNPKLLKEESFKKLLQPSLSSSVNNCEEDNQAMFFTIDRNNYGITYQLTGMNGGDYCINTMMYFDPKTELGYIFMGNTGGSERNHMNHVRISRALTSLGDYHLMQTSSLGEKIKYKWHNWYNRVAAIF